MEPETRRSLGETGRMTDDREVLDVLGALRRAGVTAWVDGGWGVDALLGTQTRTHADVDIVVQRADMRAAVEALSERGYRPDNTAVPGLPARLVLCRQSAVVDLHLVVIDGYGNGWQELDDRAWGCYPADGLAGEGRIAGQPVRCVSAELQVRHHLGYPPSSKDRSDMRALADAFGVALPPTW